MLNKTNKALEIISDNKMRDRMATRVDVLEKIKGLTLLPDDVHISVVAAAEYYEVEYDTMQRVVQRHREELSEDGIRVLRGQELASYKEFLAERNVTLSARSNLTLLTRRALLRIGMLLRNSYVATQVRSYLLNVEEIARHEVHDIIEKALAEERLTRLKALIEIEQARINSQIKN